MVHLGAFLEKGKSICPHKNMLIFYELIAGQFFFVLFLLILMVFVVVLDGFFFVVVVVYS